MIRMKKIVRTVVGVILIILGFVALVTPLSPGSWLILVGLELLGLRILLQDKLLAWAKAHPNSTSAKILCRFLRIRERDAEAKKKRQDACKS
jgi:protein-S-isoprenylcysteine O-methyltransferase Ste14